MTDTTVIEIALRMMTVTAKVAAPILVTSLVIGLAVSLFQPRPPVVRDYYSEIPISLNAEAGYHQIGEFFERVAKMARVVNITEIKLSSARVISCGYSSTAPASGSKSCFSVMLKLDFSARAP